MEPRADQPPISIVNTAIAFEGGMALVALLAGYFLGHPALGSARWTLLGLVQGLLATAPLLVGLVALDYIPSGPLKQLDQFVRTSLVPLFRALSFGELLIIAGLAGLGEEMLFRGVLQPWIAEFSNSPAVGLFAASVLFGLAHALSRTYVVLATLIGAYLGALLLWTDNLLVPIVAHAAYDLFALVYLIRTTPEESADSSL